MEQLRRQKHVNRIILLGLLMFIIALISSCASVKTIKVYKINLFFDEIAQNYEDIQKIIIQEVDYSINVTFILHQDMSSEDMQEVFVQTRDYMNEEQTKKLIGQYLGDELQARKLYIRFENPSLKEYWVYSFDQEKGQWEVLSPQNEGYIKIPIEDEEKHEV